VNTYDDGVTEDHQDGIRGRRKIPKMNVPLSSSESNHGSNADHVARSLVPKHVEDDEYLPSEEAEGVEWEELSEVGVPDRQREGKGGGTKNREVAAGSTPNTQT
jgi:hypothetical protein